MDYMQIDGQLWAELVRVAAKYLEENKAYVDSLNVFPVPDGDTGTNMSLTMFSAVKALEGKTEKHIGNVAKAVSYGALMGARGNSGVILSQLFAGFAKEAEGKENLDRLGFARALQAAVDMAYHAVMNPVEGTILSVSKEAAQAALSTAMQDGTNLDNVLESACWGAKLALEKTPTQLPVLKQAGVVDAGGQGFVYILDGMLKALRGGETDTSLKPSVLEPEKNNIEYFDGGVLEYQYCTEFILKKKEQALNLDDIRSFLAELGDCVLVVGNPETSKIHIHTNHPGTVLEYGVELGTLHEVQINNMSEQSREMVAKTKGMKNLGIICVAVGSGLTEIFKSLGVDAVIAGGQTMNPSTQDFIEAIDNVLAEKVLILPNNGNVLLAALQAAGVAGKPCQVVETKTIPQGIAALMAFNPENDILENKAKMDEACKSVLTLEVTYAVRQSQYNGYGIEEGQILGIADGELMVVGDNPASVIEELIDKNLKPEFELITIYYGEDVEESEARKMVENLSPKYADLDFELHFGGQPLYYYLISLE